MGCVKSLAANNEDEKEFVPRRLTAEDLCAIKEEEERRVRQHLTENIVRVEYERGNYSFDAFDFLTITAFLDLNEFYNTAGVILGTGMTGSVTVCTNKKTKVKYALKTLTKARVMQDKLKQLREEIKIMTELDHPHILRLHECFENDDNIYLILDLCTGKNLDTIFY